MVGEVDMIRDIVWEQHVLPASYTSLHHTFVGVLQLFEIVKHVSDTVAVLVPTHGLQGLRI
jgi:hypothetical protein